MPEQDPVARLNAALEGRYHIERQLGEGGMATVYLADDLRHERKVALKVLKPELAAVVGAERFLAEIKTTANLQHPHILPLFDSGEADGFLFYAMPYVEGESLRERLDREKQLPVEEAVRIATDVADALDAAHEQGVVHRDVKPANILLIRGRPLVTDFGIALALDAAGGERLTETGLSLGTPYYMSPEQATGDGPVGQATDTYSLGCVLYEMLVGEPPFTGGTSQAILGKIITVDAPRISSQRKTVPPHVDAAVRKSLEKLPADRFPSTRAFGEALGDSSFRYGEVGVAPAVEAAPPGTRNRSVVAGSIAAGLAVVAVGWALLRPGAAPPPASVERSVAVLPCVNMSGDPDNEYFSDGITEELLNALAQIPDLRVPARTSSFAFKGQNVPIRQIADTLDVAHVLECSVRRDQRRVLITAQLVNAETDAQMWSQTFERELDDIFAIQREIAQTTADHLQITLSGETRARLAADATEIPEAHEAYLRGRYLLEQRSMEALENAIAQFQRATELDPEYAEAYAGLADTYVLQASSLWLPDVTDFRTRTRLGLAASERALEIDPGLGIAYTALGFGHWNLGEWEAAEDAFREAIRLSPQYALAHQWYGLHLFTTGSTEEGVREAERAVELDPLYRQGYRNLVWGLVAAGRIGDAIETCDDLVELAPDWFFAWENCGYVLLAHGDPDEGMAAILEGARLGGYLDDGYEAAVRAAGRYVRTGEPQPVRVPDGLMLDEGLNLYLYTGQTDRALEEIESYVEIGRIGVTALGHTSFWFGPIHDDLRYRALLEEAGIVW